MDRAIVTWDPDVVPVSEVATSKHPVLGETGYYALVAAHLDAEADLWKDLELLYIGGAHEGPLRGALVAEVPEHADAAARAAAKGKVAVAMLGTLTDASLQRRTKPFLKDIEHCLVLRNDPEISQLPADFQETRHLSVVNRGDFAPLNWRSLMRPSA